MVLRSRNDGALGAEKQSSARPDRAGERVLALGIPEPDEGVVTHDATTVMGDPFRVES